MKPLSALNRSPVALTVIFFLTVANLTLFRQIRSLYQSGTAVCVNKATPDVVAIPPPTPLPSQSPSLEAEPEPEPKPDPVPDPVPEPEPPQNLGPSRAIPAKVWQKAGPKGVSDEARDLMQKWLYHNPHFRYEVLMDASGEQYVRDHYAYWPEALNTFLDLKVPIVKADLLRILILYADGGVYADLDVACETPVDSWIPAEYAGKVNAVVGIEFDGWQFASWTLMAAPGLVHFKSAIEYILRQFRDTAERHGVGIADITMEMISDVVDVSGPQAITLAILESLSRTTGEDIGKANISELKEPRLLGDVLVLPQAAFAALQGGFPKDQGPYLVSHLYAGTWKNDKGGE
jgi:hypothetical protein